MLSPCVDQAPVPTVFSQKTTVIDLLLICGIWAIAVTLVNPLGAFPLNDDWAWTIAVRRWFEEGRFHPVSWSAMSLLTHVLWGVLFCKIFGYSLVTLRFCNIVMSLFGTLAAYGIARHLVPSRWPALLLAAVVAFNPVYFDLSLTFMTDITFTSLCGLSALAYLKALRTESVWWIATGTALAVAAVLCRQLALFLPMAFAVSLVVKRGLSVRALVAGAIPCMVVLGALMSLNAWMRHAGVTPSFYSYPLNVLANSKHPILHLVGMPLLQYARMMVYWGLFLLPLLLVLPPRWEQYSPRVRMVFAYGVPGLFLVLAVGAMVVFKRMMPLMQNVMAPFGVGPVPLLSPLPTSFWVVVTAVGALAGGVLLSRLLLIVHSLLAGAWRLKRDDASIARIFLLSGSVIYLGPFVITYCMDRYLPPTVIFLGAVLLMELNDTTFAPSRLATRLGWATVALFAIYSVPGTHDFLAVSRVRWNALQQLMAERNLKPAQIEGGYEFNQYYDGGENIIRNGAEYTWKRPMEAEYLVARQPEPPFDVVIRQYRVQRWLPPQSAPVLILQKH
jgi:4-amino-4-deoxy-L-arabinose transferase-like glycosyltransferase